jgi:8-oxo-dGTP diphosphatase
MIKLLYGTGNPGKMNMMRSHLAGLNIEITGLKELKYPWPEVDESGNDPLENARIKVL